MNKILIIYSILLDIKVQQLFNQAFNKSVAPCTYFSLSKGIAQNALTQPGNMLQLFKNKTHRCEIV